MESYHGIISMFPHQLWSLSCSSSIWIFPSLQTFPCPLSSHVVVAETSFGWPWWSIVDLVVLCGWLVTMIWGGRYIKFIGWLNPTRLDSSVVRASCIFPAGLGSIPSLVTFLYSNSLAPNGLCSSITESKYIKAVKKPYRWTSHNKPLGHMLVINQQIDKLAAAHVDFKEHGMPERSILPFHLLPDGDLPPPHSSSTMSTSASFSWWWRGRIWYH